MIRTELCILAVLASACGRSEYAVVLFAPDEAIAAGVYFQLHLVPGGCPDVAPNGAAPESGAVQTFRWERGEPGPPVGRLSPGLYGFYARVQDADCTVRWAGCTRIKLEGSGRGRVEVPLSSVDGPGCNDGDSCNGVETCSDGVCRSGEAPPCDDGVFCNGVETCSEGTCRSGEAPSCDDGVECTWDACKTESDACAHGPVADACSHEAGACTVAECDAEQGCATSERTCDDLDPCTEDFCEEPDGCHHVEIDRDRDTFLCSEDCDDENDAIFPGAEEICNELDDNCNEEVDEGC